MPALSFWLAYIFACFAVGLAIRDSFDQWLWLIVIAAGVLAAACLIPDKGGSDA